MGQADPFPLPIRVAYRAAASVHHGHIGDGPMTVGSVRRSGGAPRDEVQDVGRHRHDGAGLAGLMAATSARWC